MKRAPLILALSLLARSAGADDPDLSGDAILDHPSPFHIESARVRYTHFDQNGLGYQSQAGPVRGPGSEELTVEQPQLEVIAKQGDKITYRLWVPIDVITSASTEAIDKWPDAVSGASRVNEAGSLDLTTTYQSDHESSAFLRAGFHVEAPFRSWNIGVGGARSFADDNAVVAASVNQVFDWFDTFYINGDRRGHATRSSTNGNLSLTQLLSPTTVVHIDYGLTVQLGELGNTWNVVPLVDGTRGEERLPSLRHRHAFVGRLAQWLPWDGALKGFYRFYADNWGLSAHTVEVELYQRIGPAFYLRANYRFHQQSGVSFFSIDAPLDAPVRTADSDLAPFYAQTFGIKAALDLRFNRRIKDALIDFGYERYIRSNDLHASILTCSLGFRFY